MRSKPPFKIVGPPFWLEMCAGYLAWLHRKGRRPNTLLAYGYELLAFGRWLAQEAIVDVDQLTGRHLERFQDWRGARVVPKTQQVSASALRGILRWATTQEPPLCEARLWLRVEMPRVAKALPRPIPQGDLYLLLNELTPRPEQGDLLRLRTRALFFVLLSSGARISEALSLDRDQLQGRTATVVQKGGGQKMLLISETAAVAVHDYLATRTDTCRALFVSHIPGQPIDRLSRKGRKGRGQGSWDQLCKEVGVPRWTSHQLRHTCATELLRQGVNVLIIAKHLGHHGLATIENYAEVGLDSRQQMLEVMDERIRRAS